MSHYTPPKRVTVGDHRDFRHSLLTEADHDEIDEIDDQLHELDFQPAQRRSGREIESLLSILDDIGKEGSR